MTVYWIFTNSSSYFAIYVLSLRMCLSLFDLAQNTQNYLLNSLQFHLITSFRRWCHPEGYVVKFSL